MKFTKERTDKIIEYIRAGNYKEVAAQAVGINKKTLYEWIKDGEEGKNDEKSNFCNAIKKAESEAEMELVEYVKKAAPESWQAAMTILERKNYERWGRKEKHEIEDKTDRTELYKKLKESSSGE